MNVEEPGKHMGPADGRQSIERSTQPAAKPFIRPIRGDVVNVYCDSVGYEMNSKMYKNGRPAVVVQNRFGNMAGRTTLVAFITDARHYKRYLEQVVIPARYMGEYGKDSVVSCGNIDTIDLALRINQAIGIRSHLPDYLMAQVDQALMASFAIGEFHWRA